jgi:serine/threonine protein kinase
MSLSGRRRPTTSIADIIRQRQSASQEVDHSGARLATPLRNVSRKNASPPQERTIQDSPALTRSNPVNQTSQRTLQRTQTLQRPVEPVRRSNSPAVKVVDPIAEFRINESSELFRGIRSTDLIVTTKKDYRTVVCKKPRPIEFDAFVYLCCENVSDLDIRDEALKYVFLNANSVIERICYLILKTPDFADYYTQTSEMRIRDFVDDLNPNAILEEYVFGVYENNERVRFPFTDVMRKYALGQRTETEIKFETVLADKMTTVEDERELGTELLRPKTVVDRCTLQAIISGNPNEPVSVGHSQIWKATNAYGTEVAVKFISVDYFMDNEDLMKAMGWNGKKYTEKGYNIQKINKVLEEIDLDYRNRVLTSEFAFGSSYQKVGYMRTTRSVYLIMDYYPEGNALEFGDKVIQKASTVIEIASVLKAFHELRLSFNNITPQHVMLRYDKKSGNEEYHLIDFTRVSDLGIQLENVSTRGYASLSQLTGGLVSVYDDIESVMYVADTLLTGIVPEFSSVDDEIEAKFNLSNYSETIANVILAMREDQQNHQDAATGHLDMTTDEYVDDLNRIYVVLADNLEVLFNTFKSIRRIPGVELNPGEADLVNAILMDMGSSRQYSGFPVEETEKIALMIKNCVLYGVRYPENVQRDIDEFLSDSRR